MNPYRRKGSPHWQILFRDASGRERRESTHSTNKRVAEQMLAARRLEAERARAGIVDRYAESRRRPLDSIIVEYRDHLTSQERDPKYVRGVATQLRAAVAAATVGTLHDITTAPFARYIDEQRATQSANTVRHRIATLFAFGRWLVDRELWPDNPFVGIRGRRSKTRDADRKFRRRALTLAEVERLAEAALTRGLQAWASTHGGRTAGHAAEIQRRGKERAMLYWLACTTGLRSSEIAALCWADFHDLAGDMPTVTLAGRWTKNGADASIPLQGFVAQALLQLRRERSEQLGRPVREVEHAIHVPERIAEHVRKDAKHAGLIPAHRPADARLDFHALRYSTVRILRDLSIPVEVVQRIMRHSDIRLTLQTYGSVGEDAVSAAIRGVVPAPAMFRSLCGVGGSNGAKHDANRQQADDAERGGNHGSAAI